MSRIFFHPLLLFCLLLALSPACEKQEEDILQLQDPRDGRIYQVFHYGSQIWMAENLNYLTMEGSWIYGDNSIFAGQYGRLYNWETAKTACPPEWRLPTHDEWSLMVDNFGGNTSAGSALKSKDNLYLGLGGFRFAEGTYGAIEFQGVYWSGTEADPTLQTDRTAWMTAVFGNDNTVEQETVNKKYGFSVRCMRIEQQ